MYYKRQLEYIMKSMSELRDDLIKQIGELPEGTLLIYEKGGKRYYTQRIPKMGNRKKEERVGISRDREKVLALVRKMYVTKALNNVEEDIRRMDELLKIYSPVDAESVMESLKIVHPEIADGIYYGTKDSAKWAEDYENNEGFYTKDFKSVSSRGEKMRSGGEMYIASRLDHYGIPYRYEAATGIPDIPYVPDFTILRPRDRKVIFWEHFGMVNDAEYVRKNIVKVSDYIDYGIRPWDNLIITYNNEMGGFNGQEIDAMIESRLLQ